MINLLLLLTFIDLSPPLVAQDKETPLVRFNIATTGFSLYSKSLIASDKYRGDIDYEEYLFTFQLPTLFKNKKIVMLNGMEFVNFKPSVSNVLSDNLKFQKEISAEFYSLSYKFGIIKIANNGWKYLAYLKPTITSDFKEKISSDDFMFVSSLMAMKRHSEHLAYGFGLAYTSRLGRPLVIPIATLDYRKLPWSTNVVFPTRVAQFYHFKKSKIGLSFNLYGNNFNNRDIQEYDLNKLSFLRVNIGPEYDLSLTKHVFLTIRTGMTVYNRLSWTDSNDKDILNLSPKPKFFFQAAISLGR